MVKKEMMEPNGILIMNNNKLVVLENKIIFILKKKESVLFMSALFVVLSDV